MNCIIADPEFSKCNGCNQLLPINDFYIMKQKYISKRGNPTRFYQYPRKPCKRCIYRQSKKWVKNNKTRNNNSVRDWAYNKKIKLLRLMGGKCVCCGNIEFWNLTLDHIIPIRRKNHERSELTTYLLKNPDKMKEFQILCYGCNNSKNSYEKCRLDHSLKI